MTKSEFVSNLAEEVSKYTKKYNKCSLTSAIIAEGILKSTYGNKSRTKNANNIFATTTDDEENFFVTPGNSDDTKYKVYNSIEESVEDFVKSVEDVEVTEALKKIINTYNLTTYDSSDEFIPASNNTVEEKEEPQVEEKEEVIKEEEVVTSSKNIIDTEEVQSEIDSFIIRKDNETLAIYPNTFEEAKKLCDNHPGFSVCNSKGVTLYTTPIPTPSIEIKQNMLYNKGRKFDVKAVAIYINPNIPTIYRTFSGTLALYDGIERNGRYRVCRPQDINNSKGIIGWVEKCNIV